MLQSIYSNNSKTQNSEALRCSMKYAWAFCAQTTSLNRNWLNSCTSSCRRYLTSRRSTLGSTSFWAELPGSTPSLFSQWVMWTWSIPSVQLLSTMVLVSMLSGPIKSQIDSSLSSREESMSGLMHWSGRICKIRPMSQWHPRSRYMLGCRQWLQAILELEMYALTCCHQLLKSTICRTPWDNSLSIQIWAYPKTRRKIQLSWSKKVPEKVHGCLSRRSDSHNLDSDSLPS